VTDQELLNEVMVLRRALCDIQEYNIDWRLGTAENMDKVQVMADEALNRPIPAIDRRTPAVSPEPTQFGEMQRRWLMELGNPTLVAATPGAAPASERGDE
jgi:hypothetical protein